MHKYLYQYKDIDTGTVSIDQYVTDTEYSKDVIEEELTYVCQREGRILIGLV